MSKHSILDLATSLDLEAERKYASQSNKTARVKIERGHAWLIRLLPFPTNRLFRFIIPLPSPGCSAAGRFARDPLPVYNPPPA